MSVAARAPLASIPSSFSGVRGPEAPLSGLRHDFGSKSIGLAAGIALLINNITGPGVPQLPNLFVESGWMMPVMCIFVIWVMTSLSASMFCEAMRHIPGNEHFRDRVEYTTIVRYYFGNAWCIASQVGLNGALQSLNIISVVQSAKIMDVTLSSLFGKTCGFNLTPFHNIWTNSTGSALAIAGSDRFVSCINAADLDEGNGWGCHVVVIAVALTIGCWLVWVAASLHADGPSVGPGLQAINSDVATGSQAGVLGTILFNFGFVTTVPSWVNEKRPQVSVNRTVWISTILCVIIFVVMGLLPAMTFADVLQGPVTGTCARHVKDDSFNCANDLMQTLTDRNTTPKFWRDHAVLSAILQGSVYLFPIVAIISSIPVFSIVIKYNMIENGFSHRTAFLWGVLFPWLAGFPLAYMPNALQQFVNFSSLIFVSFTDFIVPCALYVVLQRGPRWSETEGCSDPWQTNCAEEAQLAARAHFAFPPRLGLSSPCRVNLAKFIALMLAVAAGVAFMITVLQGTYNFDQQTCALVGS